MFDDGHSQPCHGRLKCKWCKFDRGRNYTEARYFLTNVLDPLKHTKKVEVLVLFSWWAYIQGNVRCHTTQRQNRKAQPRPTAMLLLHQDDRRE